MQLYIISTPKYANVFPTINAYEIMYMYGYTCIYISYMYIHIWNHIHTCICILYMYNIHVYYIYIHTCMYVHVNWAKLILISVSYGDVTYFSIEMQIVTNSSSKPTYTLGCMCMTPVNLCIHMQKNLHVDTCLIHFMQQTNWVKS